MAKDWVGGSAAVFKTLGASNHTDADRQREDYYATEPKATEWLCKLERFEGRILEPSCGEGHMSRVLEAAGYEVVSRDLVDRGFARNMVNGYPIASNVPTIFAKGADTFHQMCRHLEKRRG